MTNLTKMQKDYIGRINAVILYINQHLEDDLDLKKLSSIACFSAFHFHRIFKTMTGETLNHFITRKRIEKIASKLLTGSEEDLFKMALDYGFNNPSNFTRTFKKFYGITPSEFRNKIRLPYSKIGQMDSKNGQEDLLFEQYICDINKYLNWIKMNAKIEVKKMPSLKVAYIDHVGQFDQIGRVYERLFRWAGPKGLLQNPDLKTITVYHDDPKVTEISKVRQSAGITIQNDIKAEGEIGQLNTKDDRYAVGRFEITDREFEKAWDSMCVWVAEKGYKSKDGDYYELYHNDHMTHPEKKFILDICIPVE